MAAHVPPRIFRRVPFTTEVRFRFEDFGGFVTEYSGNISLGGMFVRTDAPPPVGTHLDVEFKLDDDVELIRGRGRVIWVREAGGGPEDPAGMGVRFLELTAGSRELIFQVVDRYVHQGGTPFDVEAETVQAAQSRPPVPPAEPMAPPERPGAAVETVFGSVPAPRPDAGPGSLPAFEERLLPRSAVAVPPEPGSPARAARHHSAPRGRRVWTAGRMAAAGVVLAVAAGALLGWRYREEVASWFAGLRSRVPTETVAASGGAPEGFGSRAEPAAAAGGEEASAQVAVASDAGGADGVAAVPAVAVEPAADLSARSGAAASVPASEPVSLEGPPPTRVQKITWREEAGATEVIIWTDGAVAGVYRHAHLGGPVPREVIRLQGIEEAFVPGVLPVASGQVRQVRTGYHPELSPGELHVVLDLMGTGVSLAAVDEDGSRLRIRLEGR